MTSEGRVRLHEPEAGSGPSPDPVESPTSETSEPDPQALLPGSHPSSADTSPSPSAEASGLLSLPWDIVSLIASHLPAQCVLTVLPKVCHVLGNVCKDNTAWQLRAHRLIGSQTGFPVGPREDFDWPSACLEMEQLITCWTGQVHTQEGVAEREQVGPHQRAGQDGVPVAEGQEGGREDEVEGVVVEAPDAAYGEFADPRDQGNERQAEIEPCQSPRSPRPTPALECITFPTCHIADIMSILLVGGEGAVCATGSKDRDVNLWDLQADSAGTLLHNLGGQGHIRTHDGWVWCLASQGPLLASGSFDSTVKLWDLQAGGAQRGLIRTGAAVLCLSCQTDVLLAGTFDKRVNLYDTRAAEPLVKSLQLHRGAVLCLAADDKYIISGSEDCTMSVYDRRAGKSLNNFRLSSYLQSMSYSGCEVWAGDKSGMLHSFSLQEGILKPLSQFDVGHTDPINGIHRSAGSLYTCSFDRTLKVHIPSAPPRTLCTLHPKDGVHALSVEAGVLAVASGECVEVWRPRK